MILLILNHLLLNYWMRKTRMMMMMMNWIDYYHCYWYEIWIVFVLNHFQWLKNSKECRQDAKKNFLFANILTHSVMICVFLMISTIVDLSKNYTQTQCISLILSNQLTMIYSTEEQVHILIFELLLSSEHFTNERFPFDISKYTSLPSYVRFLIFSLFHYHQVCISMLFLDNISHHYNHQCYKCEEFLSLSLKFFKSSFLLIGDVVQNIM